mmetsp:Transcript_38798/g.98204  ORF Transcript_38798/g.98204 Transcript_38798/m.98204 type:complete len:289 (+) Transcript_38798:298-1164(+)
MGCVRRCVGEHRGESLRCQPLPIPYLPLASRPSRDSLPAPSILRFQIPFGFCVCDHPGRHLRQGALRHHPRQCGLAARYRGVHADSHQPDACAVAPRRGRQQRRSWGWRGAARAWFCGERTAWGCGRRDAAGCSGGSTGSSGGGRHRARPLWLALRAWQRALRAHLGGAHLQRDRVPGGDGAGLGVRGRERQPAVEGPHLGHASQPQRWHHCLRIPHLLQRAHARLSGCAAGLAHSAGQHHVRSGGVPHLALRRGAPRGCPHAQGCGGGGCGCGGNGAGTGREHGGAS